MLAPGESATETELVARRERVLELARGLSCVENVEVLFWSLAQGRLADYLCLLVQSDESR